LFVPDEPEYWYFELVVMIQKMVMTGALCIAAPGTSVQILLATLVMLFYMLFLLKTAPYEEDSEDWSSFVGALCITLTTIGGFAFITDDAKNPTYGGNSLTYILVVLNIGSILLELLIIVFMDCGVYDKWILGRQEKVERTARNRTTTMTQKFTENGKKKTSVMPSRLTLPSEEEKEREELISEISTINIPISPKSSFVPPSMNVEKKAAIPVPPPPAAATAPIAYKGKMTWGRLNGIRSEFGDKSPEYLAAMECDIVDSDSDEES